MIRLPLPLMLCVSALAFAQAPGQAETSSHACPLQGLQKGTLTLSPEGAVALFDGARRVATATLSDFSFNAAKGEVSCAGTQVSIASQMPFKATEVSTTLTWASGALQAGTTRVTDASADALAAAEKALQAGKLEEALRQLENVSYPGQYYDETEMAVRVLKRAHEVATQRYKARDAAGAARVLQAAFAHFTPFAEKPDGSPSLPPARLTALRNDYGFFLAEAGRSAEAETQLRAVVEAAPERAVARLNLADALWAQDKKAEAEAQYREYARRVARKKWPATLLERCPACATTP